MIIVFWLILWLCMGSPAVWNGGPTSWFWGLLVCVLIATLLGK